MPVSPIVTVKPVLELQVLTMGPVKSVRLASTRNTTSKIAFRVLTVHPRLLPVLGALVQIVTQMTPKTFACVIQATQNLTICLWAALLVTTQRT